MGLAGFASLGLALGNFLCATLTRVVVLADQLIRGAFYVRQRSPSTPLLFNCSFSRASVIAPPNFLYCHDKLSMYWIYLLKNLFSFISILVTNNIEIQSNAVLGLNVLFVTLMIKFTEFSYGIGDMSTQSVVVFLLKVDKGSRAYLIRLRGHAFKFHQQRCCCCCCLGIAPRAKMLKISAWPLHPKWWQGSTYRTR